MKAMILAAGQGKRMRPLTHTTAKALLQIGNKSLIEHNIISLVKAGITDLVINLHHFGDRIQSHLGSGEQFGASIHYSHETILLDTAGGILNAMDMIGTESFAVVNADIFTDYDFTGLTRLSLADKKNSILGHLVLVDNPDHNPTGDFAMSNTRVDGRCLLHLGREDRLTWSGISVLHTGLFEGLGAGKTPLRDLFLPAITAGRMTGEHFKGRWTDVGTPERLDSLIEAEKRR